jgi:spore maturation protein CgeB
VAASEEEWYEKLKILITEPEMRKKIRENAITGALTYYTTEHGSSPEFYDFLRKIIG